MEEIMKTVQHVPRSKVKWLAKYIKYGLWAGAVLVCYVRERHCHCPIHYSHQHRRIYFMCELHEFITNVSYSYNEKTERVPTTVRMTVQCSPLSPPTFITHHTPPLKLLVAAKAIIIIIHIKQNGSMIEGEYRTVH